MMSALQQLVNDKNVIVVGPSPHLEGAGMGEFIDSFDIICRLNEVFPTGMEKDYGSRTDIVFWNLATAAMKDLKQMIKEEAERTKSIKLVVCPRHSEHVEPYHLKNIDSNNNVFKNYKSLNIQNDFFHIGDDENQRLEKEIGCHPTTGTLALCMLMQCELKNLHISGMSFYQTKTRYNKATQKSLTNANNGVTPAFCFSPPGHDIGKEIQFLKKQIIDYKYLKCEKMSGDYFFEKIFPN